MKELSAVQRFERLVRAAVALDRAYRRNRERVVAILNRYPHDASLWALNYGDCPIEYRVDHKDATNTGLRPNYVLIFATRDERPPNVTPDGQELFRLDRWLATLASRREVLRRYRDTLLKEVKLT